MDEAAVRRAGTPPGAVTVTMRATEAKRAEAVATLRQAADRIEAAETTADGEFALGMADRKLWIAANQVARGLLG